MVILDCYSVFSYQSLMQTCTCTPRDENGGRLLILSSSTFLIEDPGSLFCSWSVKTKDTGFPITNVGNDKRGYFHTKDR